MIYNYDDYVINESLINEDFSFNDIKSKIMSLKDKNKAINYLISKFNSAVDFSRKIKISKIILLIYMMTLSNNMATSLSANVDMTSSRLANFKTLTMEDIETEMNRIMEYHKSDYIFNTKLDMYKDPTNLTLSNKGKENIKKHETLQLVAYEIGDDMITIGYGHSEPAKKSKFKVGDKISEPHANKLFEHDVYEKAKNIRSMFKEWEIKNKRKVLITQSMFDAIVSMAYNIGITGFRNTDFVEYLEKGQIKNAADVIKQTKISNKFPGLKDRRQFEYDLFMKDLNDWYNKEKINLLHNT